MRTSEENLKYSNKINSSGTEAVRVFQTWQLFVSCGQEIARVEDIFSPRPTSRY